MKKFFKTFALLLLGMFLLVSGMDAGLGRLSASAQQGSFTVYNERGETVFAYNGDLNACRALAKPSVNWAPRFLHRT